MSNIIVYANNADGTDISVINPAPGITGKALQDLVNETAATKFGVHVSSADSLPDVPHQLLGCLKMNVDLKVVGADLEKAKEIWKDEWRAVRAPLLAQLDVEYIRALESNDVARMSEIVSQKQALRDVTDTPIDAFSAHDVVKVWPAILNG